MGRVLRIAILAAAFGCGRMNATPDLRLAEAAIERGDLGAAIDLLNLSIDSQPTPQAYVLRAELFGRENRYGNAIDDLRCALDLSPGESSLRDLLKNYELEDARLRVKFADRNDALDRAERELRSQLAHRQISELRREIETSAHWAEKTPAQREAYLQAAMAKGTDRVAQEAFARHWRDDHGSHAPETTIQAWLEEIDAYHRF